MGVFAVSDDNRIRFKDIRWRYVNLCYRSERDAYVRGELARAGIKAERFNALTGYDYNGPKLRKNALTRGQLGCLMSHLRLIETARSTDGILGIVEDDVMFCDDLAERFRYIEEHFDKPWDMFFLGSTYHINPAVWHKADLGRDFEQTDIKYIHRIYGTWNTYAYLVNCSSAAKIAALMRANLGLAQAVDRLFITLEPQLNCYCFTPGAAFQKNGPSDVGNGMTLFDGFLKMGPYVFTRKLEDFQYDLFDWAESKRKEP